MAGEAGDRRDRRDWLESITIADAKAGKQRTPRTKTLAAHASLELAEPKRLAFTAVKLNIPLEDSLKLKKTLMESALAAYDRSASYGIAEVTTVATFRIAGLYQQLSTDLMGSERPDGLSEDELEQYEILLEEQAFPFEEKAIELYQVQCVPGRRGCVRRVGGEQLSTARHIDAGKVRQIRKGRGLCGDPILIISNSVMA